MNTMAKFMRYIACTGQIKMATIGYSPLPVQLSQFMANAIGYMTGQAPTTLTVKNCANPQFQGREPGGRRHPAAPTRPPTSLRRLHLGGSSSSGARLVRAAKSGGKVTAKAAVVKTSSGKTRGGGGGDGYRIEGAWDVRRDGIHNDKRIFERLEPVATSVVWLSPSTGGLRGTVGRA